MKIGGLKTAVFFDNFLQNCPRRFFKNYLNPRKMPLSGKISD